MLALNYIHFHGGKVAIIIVGLQLSLLEYVWICYLQNIPIHTIFFGIGQYSYQDYNNYTYPRAKKSSDGKIIYWFSSGLNGGSQGGSQEKQYNVKNAIYYWMIIG